MLKIASRGMSNEKSFGTSHIGSHTSLRKELCDYCEFDKTFPNWHLCLKII